MKFKIPDALFGKSLEDCHKDYLEDLKRKGTKPPPPNPTLKGDFSLEDLADFWTIHGISYRNEIYTVDLQKILLDNGSSKTQQQWSEFSKQAIQNNGFYVGNYPLYHSLFSSLYKNKGNQTYKDKIEEIRQFLKDKFFNHYLITLTRIIYTTSGKDKVIHNYGLNDQYETKEDIIGPNELVKTASNKAPYKALLDTDDIDEINNIYKWITEKDAYLWRINKKPKKKEDERVAGFGADSSRAFLGCPGDPGYSDPALGVRVAKNR